MEPEKKANGAFVGLVIIIIILVIGGIYIWQSNKNTIKSPVQPTVTNEDTAELNSLETELGNTDITTGVDVDAIN